MGNDGSSFGERVVRNASGNAARFREVFARAPVPMLIADADGAVLEANDAFARMLGYQSAAEVVGRAGMLFFERRQLTRVSRADGDRSFRARWESHRGGARQVLEVTAWAIDLPGDEPPAIAVSFAEGIDDAARRTVRTAARSEMPEGLPARPNVDAPRAGSFDATEASLLAELALDLEQRLEVLRARAAHRKVVRALEECQARLGAELAAIEQQPVARDIREVLTTMGSLVRALDPERLPRQRQVIEGLDASIARTAQSLRDGAKDGASDLGAMVEAQRGLLESVMGTRIFVRVERAPTELPVDLDERLVERILWTLALEARDAMLDGGTMTIETGWSPSSSHAFLAVSESATDSDYDLGGRIFDPGEGSGPGLGSIWQAVEEHRGWLEVDGELGRGAKLTVWLPMSVKRETAGAGETILLLEEEATTRLALARLLRSLGYRVADVDSIEEARRTARALGAALDMVITDLDGAARELVAGPARPCAMGIRGRAPFLSDVASWMQPLEQPFDTTHWSRQVRECLDARRRPISRRASSRASSLRRRSRCSARRSAR